MVLSTLIILYSYDPHQLPLNISKAELSAINKLCRNKDLIISRPDKGNGIVILDRQDYVRKVTSILEDTTKFLPLDSDMLEICQKRENRLVRFLRDSLFKKKLISDSVYHDLFPTGSTPGILYGLPIIYFIFYMVHKTNCPVRPILSAIGTYNYKLAKFSFLYYNLSLPINLQLRILSLLLMKSPLFLITPTL